MSWLITAELILIALLTVGGDKQEEVVEKVDNIELRGGQNESNDVQRERGS